MLNCGIPGHADESWKGDFSSTSLCCCALVGKVSECWCWKCKQKKMEIQLLKRLDHCWNLLKFAYSLFVCLSSRRVGQMLKQTRNKAAAFSLTRSEKCEGLQGERLFYACQAPSTESIEPPDNIFYSSSSSSSDISVSLAICFIFWQFTLCYTIYSIKPIAKSVQRYFNYFLCPFHRHCMYLRKVVRDVWYIPDFGDRKKHCLRSFKWLCYLFTNAIY